jgi:transposase
MGFGWGHDSRGFLSANDRRALTRLARAGREEHRVARRANAIVLLDQGWSCERVAEALLLDDTVRNWHRAHERGGIEALKTFDHDGSSSHLTEEQEVALAAWVDAHCPHSIRKVGAYLRRTFGVSYSRSGLIALLHRLGFHYRKPEAMPRRHRRRQTAGLHRRIREAAQHDGHRRGGRLCRCGPSDPSVILSDVLPSNRLGRHYSRFQAARINESKGLRSENAAKIAAINTGW